MKPSVVQQQELDSARKILQDDEGADETRYAVQIVAGLAEQGVPEAVYAVGTWHAFGVYDYPLDAKLAVAMWRKAAKYFWPAALYDLAVSYDLGKGVRRSSRKAFEYYLLAALAGDGDAKVQISNMFDYGEGCEESQHLAKQIRNLTAFQSI